ncbi:hypothetical protein SK128_001695, partial [Halocaridina rubra]
WVAGVWGECSEYCDIGVQHRIVSCALPLLQSGSPKAAALYLDPKECKKPKPRAVRLCRGQCLPVECSSRDNVFHPGCKHLLKDLALEQDHQEPKLKVVRVN